jgi:hypothetical protein
MFQTLSFFERLRGYLHIFYLQIRPSTLPPYDLLATKIRLQCAELRRPARLLLLTWMARHVEVRGQVSTSRVVFRRSLAGGRQAGEEERPHSSG